MINRIQFNGSDISKKFIFFSKNFHQNLNVNLSTEVHKNLFKDSIFFSKGVTLLYEKKNISYLSNFVKYCEAGSFDISLYPQGKTISLNTGYDLYYPSYEDSIKLVTNSKKKFFIREKKIKESKIYVEILFCKDEILKKVNESFVEIKTLKRFYKINKYLSLKKFQVLELSNFFK